MALTGHNEGTWVMLGAFPGRREERAHDLPVAVVVRHEVRVGGKDDFLGVAKSVGERQLSSKTIAEAIRSLIESGELPPAAQLPSQRDLASAYGTSKLTVTAKYLTSVPSGARPGWQS